MPKIIRFYVRETYGVRREYIHPDNKGEASILSALTGQKTVDGRIRELVRDLTGGAISFEQVLPPN